MTLMTNPTGRDEAPPDAPSPDAPPAQQATTKPSVEQQPAASPPTAAPSVEPQAAAAPPPDAPPTAAQPATAAPSMVGLETDAKFDRVMGRIDDLEQSVRKSRGLSARGFYTMAAAFVMLGVGGFTYIGDRVQHTNERADAVLVELRESEARQAAQLRDSEARQIARVDAVLVELRESEVRQIARVDELARELRAEIRAEVRASEERQNSRIDELAVELRAAMDVLADIQARLVRLETTAGLPPLPVAQPTSATADDS